MTVLPTEPMNRNSHKYNVSEKHRRTYRGWLFASLAEMRCAVEIDTDPEIRWWLRQVNFDLGDDFRASVDFVVQYKDGTVEAVEVKGRETPRWRTVRRLWLKYGPMPLRVVKNGKTVEVLPEVPR